MKLHLPKMLLTAVLAACVAPATWAAIIGPGQYVDGTTPTEPPAAFTLTATEDTAWDLTTVTKKTITINAEGCDVKFTGRTNSNDGENYLENVVADSFWMAGGSAQVDKASDLSSAGDIYLGGGQIQFTNSMTLENAFTLGAASNVNTSFTSLNTALRVGVWSKSDVAITLSGDVNVQEDTTIGFQNGGTLNLTGTLTGSGDITVSRYDGTSSMTIAANTATYTGVIHTDKSGVSIKLGKDAVQIGGITGASSLTLADGTTASTLTLNVAAGKELTYTGSIASGISVVKSGDGKQILSGQTLANNLTVSAGTLVLNNITTNGEMEISGSGTLQINNTIINNGNLTISAGDIKLVDDLTQYTVKTPGSESYSIDTDKRNGFKVLHDASLYLAQGTGITSTTSTASNSSDSFNLSCDETGIWFTASEVDTRVFYVTEGSVDVVGVGGTGTETGAKQYLIEANGTLNLTSGSITTATIENNGGAINLASKDASLVINTSDSASYLTDVTGSGNIEVHTTTNLAHGDTFGVTGNIIVTNAANLILGRNTNPSAAEGESINVSNTIVINNGTLTFGGDTSTLDKVTTTSLTDANAVNKLSIYDMYGSGDNASGVLKIKELEANGNLQIQSSWKSNLNIEKLTGAGEVQLLERVSGNNQVVTINASTEYTGQLNLDGGSSMTLNLNIADKATTHIKGDNDSTIAQLNIGAGGKLVFDTSGARTFTLSDVKVGKTATISTSNKHGGWQGRIDITALNLADGVESGTLNLISDTITSQRSIVNLNGGSYTGTINVVGSDNGSTTDPRKLALNINHEDVAANAVITLNGKNGQAAVALGADTVKVAGIKDAEGAGGTRYIISGAQAYNSNAAFAADGTKRTLHINTNGSDAATSAQLLGSMNITKKGEGKQTFSGQADAVQGNAVSVEGGELALTGTESLNVSELKVLAGSVLTVGANGNGNISVGSAAVTVEESATSYAAVFEGGATIKGNLDLTNTTSLTMNALNNSTVSIEGGLTLSTGTMSLAGDVLTSLSTLTEGGKLNLFTVSDAFTLNAKAITALTEKDATLLSTVFNNSDLSNYYLGYENNTVYAGLVTPNAPVIDPTIPEPTTATLSLLALAALAARRRRK